MGFLYNEYILIIVLRYYNLKSYTNIYLSIDSERRRYLLYSSVLSGVLYGLKAEIVRVEVDVVQDLFNRSKTFVLILICGSDVISHEHFVEKAEEQSL